MSKFQFFCITIFVVLGVSSSFAQTLDYVQGELLIQLQDKTDSKDLLAEYRQLPQHAKSLRAVRKLKAPMDVWKFSFDFNLIDNDLIIRQLNSLNAVSVVQNNHLISPRSTFPDDPLFSSQWQWFNEGSGGMADADVDAELAWDITTGGTTPDGVEIVVAVLDDGTELTHPDLIDNHWVNVDEIPDNDIDDDNNGYVDDYNGWSIITDNDIVSGGNHGVRVNGMIGAKGNNSLGVTGINWDVKIMTVKNNFNTQEDRVLEAYAYPYTMRKRFNESNGTEGAFVVASNASWGIDGGDPADSPIWCQFYDSLGVQGILNCGATTNETTNVDENGDLPTTCPSDYLISVTRSSNSDIQSGGFGPIHIDLAAPGDDVFTTAINAGYSETLGTSFSSPLVAGIVALLYAAPCPNLNSLAKTNPGLAALEARRLILENVDLLDGFENLVSTAGRVNAFNALNEMVLNCGPCPPPIAVSAENIQLTSADISWLDSDNATSSNLKYRKKGTLDWMELTNISSPYSLNDLSNCTEYEFQLQHECLDSMEISEYTPSYEFKTDGCCEAPTLLIDEITHTSIEILWDAVTLAESYTLRYRVIDSTDWILVETSTTNFILEDLLFCQSYELEIKTNCPGVTTDFSPTVMARTLGCGPCIENNYCSVEGDANLEYIDRVLINDIENNSGSNGGYALFDQSPPTLALGSENNLKVYIGYSSFNYEEVVTAFIDYNADGEFSVDENIGNQKASDSVAIDFTVPFTATPGLARMRIIMGFDANVNASCPATLNGEVEDYCLFINNPSLECEFDGLLDTIENSGSSILLTWPAQNSALQYQLRWKKSTDPDWNGVLIQDTEYDLTGLEYFHCPAEFPHKL